MCFKGGASCFVVQYKSQVHVHVSLPVEMLVVMGLQQLGKESQKQSKIG